MSFEDKISAAVGTCRTDEAADAARWRGQCVDGYAQIEFLVGTALRELWGNGHKAPPQPLFTYRTKIAALREAVGSSGFISYPQLFSTMEQLYAACDRRNLIVHSSGSVSRTPAGDWVWTGCFLPADRPSEIVSEAITQSEADSFEEDLRRTVQRLSGQLSTLRKKAANR